MTDIHETPGDESDLEEPPIVFGGDDPEEESGSDIVFPGEDPDESEADS
jgi:hypothetical protein